MCWCRASSSCLPLSKSISLCETKENGFRSGLSGKADTGHRFTHLGVSLPLFRLVLKGDQRETTHDTHPVVGTQGQFELLVESLSKPAGLPALATVPETDQGLLARERANPTRFFTR